MAPNAKRLIYFENWMDPVAVSMLEARPDIELVRLEYATSADENWRWVEGTHGYQIAPRTELKEPWFANEALIARCPSLVAVSSTGAGYDMVDTEACTRAGIAVVNQSGTNKEAVAEHALGLMLALSKKIGLADKAMRRTRDLDRYHYAGNDIRGKTVGIVGIGQIGSRVAELCRGLFQMRVLAYDPYLDQHEVGRRGAEKVSLEALLARSDFVSVHCPRTAETLGMLDRAAFARMKPTAFFLNTARGGIHVEDDLAAVLAEGGIAGAGIDVFLHEPPAPEHPLLGFDNVIATPHTAGMTAEAMHDMAAAAAEQWIEIFAGRRPPRLANPEVWPRYVERFERIMGFRPAD